MWALRLAVFLIYFLDITRAATTPTTITATTQYSEYESAYKTTESTQVASPLEVTTVSLAATTEMKKILFDDDSDMNGTNIARGCILPDDPPHGSFSFKTCNLNNDSRNQIYSPGSVVKSYCILELLCDDGFRLTEQNHQGFLECVNSAWRPQLNEMGCEEIILNTEPALSNSTLEGCILPEDARHRKFFSWVPDSNGNLRSYPPGARLEEGSIKVVCEDGYALPNKTEYFTIVCFENSWISGVIPECGVPGIIRTMSTTSPPAAYTISIEDSTTQYYYNIAPTENTEPPGFPTQPHSGTGYGSHHGSSQCRYGCGGYGGGEKVCTLPNGQNNRRYLSWNWDSNSTYVWTYQPGSSVVTKSLVKVQCEPGYGLSDYKNFVRLYCDETPEWTPQGFPDCMKMCPPLESHTMYVTCSYIDSQTGLRREVDCHKEMLPTTVARYTCKPGYSEYSCLAEEDVYRRTLTCRKDGRWSNILPECSSVSEGISGPAVKIKMFGSLDAVFGGCFLPEDPNNRIFSPVNSKVTEMYSPGAKVKGAVEVRCIDGYVLPGNKKETQIFCDEDYWVPEEMPECKGTVSDAASQPMVSQLISAPVYKGCTLPEEPQNRIFLPGTRNKNSKQIGKYSPGAKVNGEVEIRCDDGYVLPENKKQITIFCNEDHWIPEEIPECKGMIQPQSDGNSQRVKLWHTRIKVVEGCLLPKEPQNRRFYSYTDRNTIDMYSPGAKVKGTVAMRCEDGYELPDNKQQMIISCNRNHWTPEKIPECQALKLFGSAGGTNSGKLLQKPIREPVTGGCLLPQKSENRRFIPTNKVTNGSPMLIYSPGAKVEGAVDVQCEKGFVFADNSTQTKIFCHKNHWIPEKMPQCQSIHSHLVSPNILREVVSGGCTLPEKPDNRRFLPSTSDKTSKLQWIYSPGIKVDGAIDIRCEAGYALPGNKSQTTIFCYKGKWIPDPVPECHKSIAKLEQPLISVPKSRSVRQSGQESSECIVPQGPNKKYFPFKSAVNNDSIEITYLPGARVSGQIKVQCEAGYGFPGNKNHVIISCYNGQWLPESVRQCVKTCRPLYSSSMYITCTYGSKRVDCSKPMLPTTTATYLCRPGYVEYSCLDVYDRTLTCESSGKWSHWLPECKPECGVSKGGGRVVPTVVNGTSVAQGQFPWHVGLYLRKDKDEDKYTYICGGSLISDRIVLTAAHCVGRFAVEDLKVAVGKYYRSWEHEEEHAVRLNVTTVRLPVEYQSVATDYAFDIALLLLSDSLAFNSFILPVCLDIHREFNIPTNATGYVVGWGSPDTNEKPPEDLLSSELVINNYESCKKRLPRTLIFDKFCASKNTGTTVQKGDSGGGITTVFNGLHYVFGIVSIRFIQTSIFTNLTWVPHKTWLDNEIDSFNVI